MFKLFPSDIRCYINLKEYFGGRKRAGTFEGVRKWGLQMDKHGIPLSFTLTGSLIIVSPKRNIMLLDLLLEKLYGHRSDLEFMMEVYQTHYPDKPKKLSDQYASCLCNIQAYELLLQQNSIGIISGKMS